MNSLNEIQRRMANAVMQPLSPADTMQRKVNGKSMAREAGEFIKPNDRLTSFERLEIYNKQYWFRVLDSFAEDFPGLRMVLGDSLFWRIAKAYVMENPSRSFTLRNLGSSLTSWMKTKSNARRFPKDLREIAMDMVRLEWAHIEAFDAAEYPPLGLETAFDGSMTLQLQPYIHLLEFHYPVDELLMAVRRSRTGRLTSDRRHKLLAAAKRGPVYLAVHRVEFSVHYKRLEREAFRLLTNLQGGATLAESVESVFSGRSAAQREAAGHLQEWFSQWMELGWFASGGVTGTGSRANAQKHTNSRVN